MAKANREREKFEALLKRLARVPKQEVDDLERAQSSKTDPSEEPEDDEAKGEQPE